MEINPAVLVLITTGSALLGVIVTSIFNLLTTRIAKQSEERKHQKELVFNAALENWKQDKEIIQSKGGGLWDALDVYLIHMLTFSDVLFDPTTSSQNLKQRMNEAHRLVQIARETTFERRFKKQS